jgi:hypothetical protein
MKIVIFTILGIIVGWGFSSVFYNPYGATEHRLIKAQRSIERGKTLTSAVETFGEPYYHFKAGEGWPAYSSGIPSRLAFNHSLSVFYIGGFGPQLLLVVCDSNGDVAYVTSTST